MPYTARPLWSALPCLRIKYSVSALFLNTLTPWSWVLIKSLQSFGQGVPDLLRNVHDSVFKSPSLAPTLIQMNLVGALPPHISRFVSIPPFPDSSVGIATGYGLDGRCSIAGRGRFYSLFIISRPALGPTQPPIQWAPGAISPGVKQGGREADQSPPSSAVVKSSGATLPLPHTSSWHELRTGTNLTFLSFIYD
jgi:hypothetical protein